jgi:hypothetical protein
MSDLLLADHPHSLRPFVVFFPDPLHFRCYAHLMHSVKTGETTGKPALGKELFPYLGDHPEESEIFNAAMVNLTHMFIPAVLDAYNFRETRVLADIGGGHGSVLGAILQKYPDMKGILLDMEHVVRGVHRTCSRWESWSVAKSCPVTFSNPFPKAPIPTS